VNSVVNSVVNWEKRAGVLADQVTDPDSLWRPLVAAVPRHELVPRWWDADETGGWVLREGGDDDPDAWAEAAYADRSLVTRVGALHADHAMPEHARLGPQHAATSARQSPPSATARATSSRILPGSCTARGLRHGVSAADIAVSRPDLRTVSTSSTAPACETTPRSPASTRTRGYDPLRSFTWRGFFPRS